MEDYKGSARPLVVLCAVGVALRFLFLCLAGDLEFQSDEANYVYLAVSWNHFGFYSDSYRYLWPPGYPFFLAVCLDGFEMGGLFVAKLLQVLASASIGFTTMLFARRLYGGRTALVAGAIWCGYLPLIGFTHYFWSETLFLALFLPALYQVLVVLQADGGARDGRILLAGLLLAGALFVKEMPLYLAPLLALLLAVFPTGLARIEGLRRASLFLLAIAVPILPWTLRNAEVYGRFVPLGASLGENAHGGLNAPYKNFDLTAYGRHLFLEESPETLARPWFVAADPDGEWARAEHIRNTPDRLAENQRRGLAYAAEHPGWLFRSRIKKLADLVAPASFFVRHQGIGRYEESVLGQLSVRRALVSLAMLSPVILLLLAAGGWFGTRMDRTSRWLLGTVLGYVALTSLLVSMSRFRIPMVPFLIVLAAGFATRGGRAGGRRALFSIAAAWAVLACLWWVDLPETLAVIRYAWGGAS